MDHNKIINKTKSRSPLIFCTCDTPARDSSFCKSNVPPEDEVIAKIRCDLSTIIA